MEKAILAIATVVAVMFPVCAEAAKRRPVAPPNPTMIRNPPSYSAPASRTVPMTSSTTSMYPKGIKRTYDPFRNPTVRRPNDDR